MFQILARMRQEQRNPICSTCRLVCRFQIFVTRRQSQGRWINWTDSNSLLSGPTQGGRSGFIWQIHFNIPTSLNPGGLSLQYTKAVYQGSPGICHCQSIFQTIQQKELFLSVPAKTLYLELCLASPSQPYPVLHSFHHDFMPLRSIPIQIVFYLYKWERSENSFGKYHTASNIGHQGKIAYKGLD